MDYAPGRPPELDELELAAKWSPDLFGLWVQSREMDYRDPVLQLALLSCACAGGGAVCLWVVLRVLRTSRANHYRDRRLSAKKDPP